MPYIGPKRRKEIEINGTAEVTTPGELNYWITNYCLIRSWKKWPRYETIDELRKNKETLCALFLSQRWGGAFSLSDLHAAYELAFLEFYRRVGSRYEDKKAEENGDIYEGVI